MDQVAEILKKDFSAIYKDRAGRSRAHSRPILSPERTLGSVIQLLTPSPEYTDEHNEWLRQLPPDHAPAAVHREALLPAGMGRPLKNWREHFTVDRINGFLGHELKFDNQKLVSNYLRVGYDPRRLLAHLQTAARFYPGRQGAGRGRHHRFRGAAAGEPERSRSGVRQSQRQAGGQLRDAAVPAARRCDSSRRRPAGRGRYRRRRQRFHFATTSRSRSSRPRAWWSTWWSSIGTPSR